MPPGATERIFERALHRAGKSIDDYHVAHCPERVIPGAIIEELRNNARVVGGRTLRDAEIVRDVNIAFANELSIIAEELGVDVWETIDLANKHPRVDILNPGPGVGGHCIPVDPQFLSNASPFITELIQSARRVNDRLHAAVQKHPKRFAAFAALPTSTPDLDAWCHIARALGARSG